MRENTSPPKLRKLRTSKQQENSRNLEETRAHRNRESREIKFEKNEKTRESSSPPTQRKLHETKRTRENLRMSARTCSASLERTISRLRLAPCASLECSTAHQTYSDKETCEKTIRNAMLKSRVALDTWLCIYILMYT